MFSESFKNHRTVCKKSTRNDFNIERFAYDVFAYMLRICGFPENKIPISDLKENIYKDDFVKNVGLSALPIALYKRDKWRRMFQNTVIITELNFFFVQGCLNYFILSDWKNDERDTLSRVQYSLAIYFEFMQHQNLKNPESDFGLLPKMWSNFCKTLLDENKDSNQTFESALTMSPDISESWITNFIHKFALPYGNKKHISDMFSAYALEGTDMLCDETSTKSGTNTPKEIVPRESNMSDEHSKRFQPEDTDSGIDCMPSILKESSEITSVSHYLKTSVISEEHQTTFFPENIDSASSYIPGRWSGYSGQVQASDESVPQISTPEEYSVKCIPENTNSENNFFLGRWKGLSGQLQTSTSDLQPCCASNEYSSKIWHENNAGINYEPEKWYGSSRYLQTSEGSVPQISTPEECSVKFFPENTNSENNFILGRWEGLSGQLQTSKEYASPPPTPEEDSIKLSAGDTNSENNFMGRLWEGFSEQLQTSTSKLQPCCASNEYSSKIWQENNAGINYEPGKWFGSSRYLQTSEESSHSSGTSDKHSMKISSEIPNSESNYLPGRLNLPATSDQQQISEAIKSNFQSIKADIKTKTNGKNINGLNYVIRQCIKKRKRNISENLGVVDSFEKMDIDIENVSSGNLDSKRRRKIS